MKRTVLHRGRVGEFGLEEVVLPNGKAVTLEILRHPGASAVVPLHDDGSVTLLRQHRHAAGGTIWEIPAGKLEAGEDPAVCATRELLEEAGLVASHLTPLTSMWTTPAFTDEVIHLYVATGLTTAAASPEDDEILAPSRLPLARAVQLVYNGDICDGKTAVALLLTAARFPDAL